MVRLDQAPVLPGLQVVGRVLDEVVVPLDGALGLLDDRRAPPDQPVPFA